MLSIKNNFKDEKITLKLKGSINILNNKINFDLIKSNDDKPFSEKDIQYLKTVLEKNLIDEGFFKIFSKKKVKDFLTELI